MKKGHLLKYLEVGKMYECQLSGRTMIVSTLSSSEYEGHVSHTATGYFYNPITGNFDYPIIMDYQLKDIEE